MIKNMHKSEFECKIAIISDSTLGNANNDFDITHREIFQTLNKKY